MNIGVVIKEVRSENSMLYTSKILGLQLNDFKMNPEEKASLEIRLEKIESHLSSIARMRSIQLRNRKILVISGGIIFTAFVFVEILAALGVLA